MTHTQMTVNYDFRSTEVSRTARSPPPNDTEHCEGTELLAQTAGASQQDEQEQKLCQCIFGQANIVLR